MFTFWPTVSTLRDSYPKNNLLALTPNEKKVHLFDAIEARLRSNYRDIYTLREILNSDPVLDIVGEKIRSSYLEVCQCSR